MSRTYEICCTQCMKSLWIGQRDYLYTTAPHIEALTKFLHEHIDHPLVFCDSEKYPADECEEVSDDDD